MNKETVGDRDRDDDGMYEQAIEDIEEVYGPPSWFGLDEDDEPVSGDEPEIGDEPENGDEPEKKKTGCLAMLPAALARAIIGSFSRGRRGGMPHMQLLYGPPSSFGKRGR